jgi:hypothetical protein
MTMYNKITLNVSENEKYFRQNVKRKPKHTFYIQDFFSEDRAVYELVCKHMVQPDRPQRTICRMSCPCWITEATNTHSEYVMLVAYPWQQ